MKNILFVDDSEETRELVKIIFAQDDAEVRLDYAPNSQEAIHLFNANAYHACVLDVSLPDLTGYYLGKLIRTSCPHMPIAFLTNYDGNLTKENADYIDADFWSKGEVFASPMGLRQLVLDLASDKACEGKDAIQMPEIIKEIS